MKAWRRSGGLGQGESGCGHQVIAVTIANLTPGVHVEWDPDGESFDLTLEYRLDGGAWVVEDTGIPSLDLFIDYPGITPPEGTLVQFRIRRDSTSEGCAVESNAINYEP